MLDDFKTNLPKPEPGKLEDTDLEEMNSEPKFTPPENTQRSQAGQKATKEEEIIEVPEDHPKKPSPRKSKFAKLKEKLPNLTRKQWLIVGLIAVLLVAGLGYMTWKVFADKPAQPAAVAPKEEPKPEPTTAPSRLTGVEVSIKDSKIPVTAVMIENSPDARPQSGLASAGVVYEAIAEGGITRFLTLFQEDQPDYIGPVRSVRPYYLDWLVPFDAPVAHVGGSAEALAQIRAENIKDLDYGTNSGSYQRISSRYAPHNVYTSRAQLLELQKSKGWTTSKFTGFTRKKPKASATPTAKTIDFNISGPLYNPHYDYDAATNSYLRSQAGQPHIDEKAGKQIKTRVVVAIVVPRSIHPDGVHTVYGTSGTGKAYFFQDGTVTVGTWSKKDRKSEMRFLSAKGSPFALNAGNTWISVVSEAGAVTYAP